MGFSSQLPMPLPNDDVSSAPSVSDPYINIGDGEGLGAADYHLIGDGLGLGGTYAGGADSSGSSVGYSEKADGAA